MFKRLGYRGESELPIRRPCLRTDLTDGRCGGAAIACFHLKMVKIVPSSRPLYFPPLPAPWSIASEHAFQISSFVCMRPPIDCTARSFGNVISQVSLPTALCGTAPHSPLLSQRRSKAQSAGAMTPLGGRDSTCVVPESTQSRHLVIVPGGD